MIGRSLSVRSFVFVAALALCSSAVAAPDETYSLKRVYKAGEIDKYKTVITMEAENPPGTAISFTYTILTTEKVLEVKPDGSTVVETRVDNAKVKIKDIDRELDDNSVVTVTIDKNGKETKREGGGDDQRGASVKMLGLARFSSMPPHALKTGEAWKYEIPASDDKSPKTTGSVTLIGKEKPEGGGSEVLKVKCFTTVTTPSKTGDTKLEMLSTILVDPATGKPLDVDVVGNGKLGTFDAKKISVKQQRIKDAGK